MTDLIQKPIKTNLPQLLKLKELGLSFTEQFLVVTFLSLLDGANCFILTANTLTDFLDISEKQIYRTLKRLMTAYQVTKNGDRYDFTDFLKVLDNT